MRLLQGLVPLIIGAALLLAIAVFASNWLSDVSGAPFGLGLAAVAIYVLWLIAEGRLVAAKEVSKTTTRIDRGTMELYAASRGVIVFLGLGLQPSVAPTWAPMTVGLALMTAAIAWRMIAIYALGRFYSHRVRLASDHAIVESGPYRFVRHPAYTGMLLAHVGFVLVFFNWWAAAAVPCLLLPAIVFRILVEERELTKVPGYAAYASGKKRLCPMLW